MKLFTVVSRTLYPKLASRYRRKFAWLPTVLRNGDVILFESYVAHQIHYRDEVMTGWFTHKKITLDEFTKEHKNGYKGKEGS